MLDKLTYKESPTSPARSTDVGSQRHPTEGVSPLLLFFKFGISFISFTHTQACPLFDQNGSQSLNSVNSIPVVDA